MSIAEGLLPYPAGKEIVELGDSPWRSLKPLHAKTKCKWQREWGSTRCSLSPS